MTVKHIIYYRMCAVTRGHPSVACRRTCRRIEIAEGSWWDGIAGLRHVTDVLFLLFQAVLRSTDSSFYH